MCAPCTGTGFESHSPVWFMMVSGQQNLRRADQKTVSPHLWWQFYCHACFLFKGTLCPFLFPKQLSTNLEKLLEILVLTQLLLQFISFIKTSRRGEFYELLWLMWANIRHKSNWKNKVLFWLMLRRIECHGTEGVVAGPWGCLPLYWETRKPKEQDVGTS